MNSTCIILNPAARGEKAKAAITKIQQLTVGADIVITTSAGDARVLAREAAAGGYRTIVAAGGDGTVNEVVNGTAGTEALLGVLHIGTMNVYAAELGLPTNDLKKCWQLIADGHFREVDLPTANGHYFVQLAGIGFDAQVVEETSWDAKKTFGPLSYVFSATQIAARKPPKLVLESEAGVIEGSFALIGNGRYYGGPFTIFQDAKIDDGKLDVLVFKNLGYLDIVRYLNAIIFGNHARLKDVEAFQTRSLLVRSEDRVPVEVDGEVIGDLPVEFAISPVPFRVIAPPVKSAPRAEPAHAGRDSPSSGK